MPEVVELYVVMHCEACAASVKRAIKKIPGVETYQIDFYEQKVTVTGDVSREDVWRRIHKTGKRATLIPKPDPPKEEPKKEEEEKKVEETMVTEIKVEEKKQEKSEDTDEEIKEVKVHKTKEEVVTVVDTKEEAPMMMPMWMPMFVSAPYYTLPTRFY